MVAAHLGDSCTKGKRQRKVPFQPPKETQVAERLIFLPQAWRQKPSHPAADPSTPPFSVSAISTSSQHLPSYSPDWLHYHKLKTKAETKKKGREKNLEQDQKQRRARNVLHVHLPLLHLPLSTPLRMLLLQRRC